MGLAAFLFQEEAGAFQHDVHAHFAPLQVGGIFFSGQADFLAVDHQVVAVNGDVALEVAVHGVVLQHVGQVVGLQQVVDGDHFDTGEVLGDGAESHAADAAETVDTNFNCHVSLSLMLSKLAEKNARKREKAGHAGGLSRP